MQNSIVPLGTKFSSSSEVKCGVTILSSYVISLRMNKMWYVHSVMLFIQKRVKMGEPWNYSAVWKKSDAKPHIL